MYPLLSNINSPAELRRLEVTQLPLLCEELRQFVQEKTNTKEGHIRSSLGVTELSVALHYVFSTPEDILVWDVGHQAYIHKILTGRRDLFHTNRQLGGISGFTKREESEYDPFGAGHSSTSVSAIAGFATAAELRQQKRHHIAVIGDGALTAGISFEALNYIGENQLDVIIILNDNDSSIDENRGALAIHKRYESLCKALNIGYYGSIDGHHIESLVQKISELKEAKGPVFLKVNTLKGKGRVIPESNSTVRKDGKSFQQAFGEILIEEAKKEEKLVVISPAMLSGAGLTEFGNTFPERTFDTGITEQHAVTMAAAMAADGFYPLCHLYSTFSQRAVDQIIHDVALQDLPVLFCLDRAGIAGEDGPTHHGAFDISLFDPIPNIAIYSPSGVELFKTTIKTCIEKRELAIIRYVKGWGMKKVKTLEPDIGYRWLKKGKEKVIISTGAIGEEARMAVAGTKYALLDINRIKPFDTTPVLEAFNRYSKIITLEENSFNGGIAQKIKILAQEYDYRGNIYSLYLPDQFIEHGSRASLLKKTGIDIQAIEKLLAS